MEHNAKEDCRLFPSPERIDKVQDSMDRLEEVVRERNEAFWQLEVGEVPLEGRKEPVLDPEDPLAVVREPIKAVLDGLGNRKAALKFQYRLKEKENRMRIKLERYVSCIDMLKLFYSIKSLNYFIIILCLDDVNLRQ